MVRHNVTELDCIEVGDTPIVVGCYREEDTMVLDKVRLSGCSGLEFICSNNYTDGCYDASDVAIEAMVDILEWLEDNEDELFNEYSKEE